MQELVWSRYDAGDGEVINGLHTIRLATKMMADALQRDHRQLVVEALNEICKGRFTRPFDTSTISRYNRANACRWFSDGLESSGWVEAVPPFYVTQ